MNCTSDNVASISVERCTLRLMNDATRSALHRKSIDRSGKNQKVAADVTIMFGRYYRVWPFTVSAGATEGQNLEQSLPSKVQFKQVEGKVETQSREVWFCRRAAQSMAWFLTSTDQLPVLISL